jgi:hypothetical protein
MHRISGAGVELGEPQVEVAGGLGFAVNEHGADTDDLGRDRDAPQGIDNQGTTEASALSGTVNTEPSQDHAYQSPATLVGAILDLIPGCDPDGWFPEFTGLPDRFLHAGEVAWSNIMDPVAALKLLDIDQD